VVVSRALQDEPIPVYGDGTQIRDWLRVQDHCSALLAVLEAGLPGRVYNIGGGGERSNLDLIRLVLDHLGKPHSLISHVEDRPGHDWRYAVNNARARNELLWAPQPDVDAGLRDTVDWYLSHEDWWRPLVNRPQPLR
jgi:dTDP-glucose 4,6-dehydratase